MPRVSIVLPVRDAERTIGRAVRSCLEQTFRDLELIVVDDASTDATAERVEKAAGKDSFRLLRLERHTGVAGAAEAGRQLATGEFVARMDADDLAHPERIARQVACLDAEPDLAGCGTAVRLVGAKPADPGRGFSEHVRWINSLNTPDRLAAERFVDSPIANPSSMVRAADLEAIGGHQDPAWAEDYDLWLRLLGSGKRLRNLAELLLDWHDSEGRLTRSDGRYSPEMFSKAKAYYLAKLAAVTETGVDIAGAGPIGKRIARDLVDEGVRVRRFYEVNPRRVGERIAGIPVLPHSEFARDGSVLLGAVGLPGARDRIRRLALDAGFGEGIDFFAVA